MMKNSLKNLVGSAVLAAFTMTSVSAQTNVGADCGCPPVGSRTPVNMSTLAVSGGANDGNLIAESTILTCDKIYTLDKKIFVPDGKSITIKPGVVIKAAVAPPADATALVVSRGGKIFAAGTESCPIIMTAAADPLDGSFGVDNQGLWGGMVILGKATNNILATNALGIVDGVAIIEGFATADPRAYYGVDLNAGESFDDNDNSGIVQYLSIRHGGATVGPDNELNGLTLGSVGRGTTLSHIEVVANSDDGIEFFGGTVDLKYGVVFYNDDDGFDWDHGWTGRGQFWVVVKKTGKGDNGFECDGDDDDTQALPLSDPIVYNATCIGDATDEGIEAKELTRGSVYNSIFANYSSGLRLDDSRTPDAYDNWLAGTFNVENCTFVNCITPLARVNNPASASDLAKFNSDGNIAVASLPGFDFTHVINGATNVVTDPFDNVPNPAPTTSITPPVDGFFCDAPYRGAVKDGEDSWLKNWTYAAFIQSAAGLVDCPTDLNKSGSTEVNDFLILLGQFGLLCD